MSGSHARLCVPAFGLAFGIIWGAAMLALGLVGHFFGFGVNMVNVIGELYLGFEPTLLGSVIGAAWGFVDFFVAGVIVAWLYNYFADRCSSS